MKKLSNEANRKYKLVIDRIFKRKYRHPESNSYELDYYYCLMVKNRLIEFIQAGLICEATFIKWLMATDESTKPIIQTIPPPKFSEEERRAILCHLEEYQQRCFAATPTL